MLRGVDWADVKARLEGKLGEEDARLLDYLSQGASTPEVAKKMNKHRSWVWRRANTLLHLRKPLA